MLKGKEVEKIARKKEKQKTREDEKQEKRRLKEEVLFIFEISIAYSSHCVDRNH